MLYRLVFNLLNLLGVPKKSFDWGLVQRKAFICPEQRTKMVAHIHVYYGV
jgi:hypothetical protein